MNTFTEVVGLKRVVGVVALASALTLLGCDGGMSTKDAGQADADAGTDDAGSSSACQTVGAAGGTLHLAFGVTLDVPAGALAANVEICATDGGTTRAVPEPVGGLVVALEPADLTFSTPATLSFGWAEHTLPPSTDPEGVTIAARRLRVDAGTEGWAPLKTTVRSNLRLASAAVSALGPYGLTPGATQFHEGGVSGQRMPNWNNVFLFLATDTAGTLYGLGYQQGRWGPLQGSGAFVVRFNANLSVQWLVPIPVQSNNAIGNIACDQNGNVYAFVTGPYVDLKGYELILHSFNANGDERSGYPVTWTSQPMPVAMPAGLAIDELEQVHTLGMTAVVNQYIYTTAYASFSSAGVPVRARTTLAFPTPAGTDRLQSGDLAVDFGGHVYFMASYQTNNSTPGGTLVLGYNAGTFTKLPGFPQKLSAEFPLAFSKPAVSFTPAPLDKVTLPGKQLYGFTAVNSTGTAAGFPMPLSGPTSVGYSTVDASGGLRLQGTAPAGSTTRMWVGRFSPTGTAVGTPVIFGLDADSSELADSMAVDPAGTSYVSGRSLSAATGQYVGYIARLPQ